MSSGNTIWDLVNSGFSTSQAYATSAFESAMDFLDQLAAHAVDINIPTLALDWPTITTPPSDFTRPIAPTAPDVTLSNIQIPPTFVLGNIRDVTIGDVPVFLESDPVISLPVPPSPIDLGTLPTDPTVDLSFSYPVEPSFVLPTLPTLRDIALPTEPTLNFPTFSATPPVATDLTIPGLTFSFTEAEYTDSCVLNALQTELCNTLTNGGTGLNPVVEQALWDRERNREDQNATRTAAEIYDQSAARGFPLPNGTLYAKLQQASQDSQDKINSLGRDIAIKQAELEQENIKHAITSAVQLEGTLINYYSQRMQRAFEVAKYTQDSAFTLFNSLINKYNVELEVYKTAATVYDTLLRAELNKLEVYKVELEARKILGDLNEQDVRIYSAQVDTLRAQAEFYRITMDAVRTRLEGERVKLDVFRGQIEGYTAKLDAKKTDYQIYTTQIDAELSKVKVFDSKVTAFANRVQAYNAQTDALSKLVNIDISKEKLRLDSYTSVLDAAVKQSQVDVSRIDALVRIYDSQVRAYLGEGEMEKIRHDADVKTFEAELSNAQAHAQMSLSQAQFETTRITKLVELYIESTKGGAQVSAGVAQAALTAVNLSAGLNANSNTSLNHNVEYEGVTPPSGV